MWKNQHPFFPAPMEFHVIRTTDDAAVTALLHLAWDDLLTQETGVLVEK